MRGEVNSLTLLYKDFLSEVMLLYKRGVQDAAAFNRLRDRFGKKFPKIIQLLEKKHAHSREGQDTSGPG